MSDKVSRARNVVDEIESWVDSEALATLLALIHAEGQPDDVDDSPWLHLNEQLPEWLLELLAEGSVPADQDPSLQLLNRLINLEKRAADDFNFRGRAGQVYKERSEAATADFDPDTRARVLDLTTQLGLVEPTPPKHQAYDMTLVLGGGFNSPLLRSKYAASLEARGIDLGELYFLGSPRFLITGDTPEEPVTSLYAPGATDEFGLLQAAAESEFGFSSAPVDLLCGCSSTSAICPRWRHDVVDGNTADVPPEYTHERSAELTSADGRHRGSVISASTSRPPYRPDTSDTYALWAKYANPHNGQKVLTVTTQVFVPFQRFDGLRRLYLTRGLDLDAVGFGAEWGDRPQTAEYLLQETLSAIRSARRLLVDAVEVVVGG
ncbi:hypothetical protein [Rhodococcus sp. KRD162]|uniref:hypothetical protein n=1 Tax=Rhodococcus sp. KRD162 TaxID=2729725 RepID=UPI0019D0D161|nr:hypothetical protein [Rhodococcus sp. KRD162]